MHIINIGSLSDIKSAAKQFCQTMGEHNIFAFYGGMGVGKTTFIKAVCEELGVTDNVTSPTFALINEYLAGNGKPIYHFDCYRLKNIDEAYEIGMNEYLYSEHLCFIEWPEKIEELLPEHSADVSMSITGENGREVSVNLK
jgi:tRNA threonylcarbamoyladenosine biosynthesis protein TsaE